VSAISTVTVPRTSSGIARDECVKLNGTKD
jgi:hypothetical protein